MAAQKNGCFHRANHEKHQHPTQLVFDRLQKSIWAGLILRVLIFLVVSKGHEMEPMTNNTAVCSPANEGNTISINQAPSFGLQFSPFHLTPTRTRRNPRNPNQLRLPDSFWIGGLGGLNPRCFLFFRYRMDTALLTFGFPFGKLKRYAQKPRPPGSQAPISRT